ncbi:hypothetical protein ACSMEV_08695 [Pseudomonas sp. MLB6B]
MPDIVEITGALSTPYLPTSPDGLPRLIVEALDSSGTLLGLCGAQITGSPLPLRLHLDRSALADDARITLNARCLASTGSSSVILSTSRNLTLAQATAALLDLELEPVEGFEAAPDLHPLEMRVIELSGHVNIPDEVVKDTNKLDVTLLVVQEDGDSNRRFSNLAEHSMSVSGNQGEFSLFIDAASVPEGRPLRLHLGLYNHEGTEIYAGRNFRALDFGNLPDLSDITLKLPPR